MAQDTIDALNDKLKRMLNTPDTPEIGEEESYSVDGMDLGSPPKRVRFDAVHDPLPNYMASHSSGETAPNLHDGMEIDEFHRKFKAWHAGVKMPKAHRTGPPPAGAAGGAAGGAAARVPKAGECYVTDHWMWPFLSLVAGFANCRDEMAPLALILPSEFRGGSTVVNKNGVDDIRGNLERLRNALSIVEKRKNMNLERMSALDARMANAVEFSASIQTLRDHVRSVRGLQVGAASAENVASALNTWKRLLLVFSDIFALTPTNFNNLLAGNIDNFRAIMTRSKLEDYGQFVQLADAIAQMMELDTYSSILFDSSMTQAHLAQLSFYIMANALLHFSPIFFFKLISMVKTSRDEATEKFEDEVERDSYYRRWSGGKKIDMETLEPPSFSSPTRGSGRSRVDESSIAGDEDDGDEGESSFSSFSPYRVPKTRGRSSSVPTRTSLFGGGGGGGGEEEEFTLRDHAGDAQGGEPTAESISRLKDYFAKAMTTYGGGEVFTWEWRDKSILGNAVKFGNRMVDVVERDDAYLAMRDTSARKRTLESDIKALVIEMGKKPETSGVGELVANRASELQAIGGRYPYLDAAVEWVTSHRSGVDAPIMRAVIEENAHYVRNSAEFERILKEIRLEERRLEAALDEGVPIVAKNPRLKLVLVVEAAIKSAVGMIQPVTEVQEIREASEETFLRESNALSFFAELVFRIEFARIGEFLHKTENYHTREEMLHLREQINTLVSYYLMGELMVDGNRIVRSQ